MACILTVAQSQVQFINRTSILDICGSVSQNQLANFSKITRPKTATDAADDGCDIMPEQDTGIRYGIYLPLLLVVEYMLYSPPTPSSTFSKVKLHKMFF